MIKTNNICAFFRWKSSFWPRTKWAFDPVSQNSFFYTLPWPKKGTYNLQLNDQIDSIEIDHSIKKFIIIPDKDEYNIGEFARLSRCFPKVSVHILSVVYI